LLRTAVLLAPGREAGEDLLQEALERLLRKWHKVVGAPSTGQINFTDWVAKQATAPGYPRQRTRPPPPLEAR
jgi:DNA-directed RNA polymerase specialized sigma24 family protein